MTLRAFTGRRPWGSPHPMALPGLRTNRPRGPDRCSPRLGDSTCRGVSRAGPARTMSPFSKPRFSRLFMLDQGYSRLFKVKNCAFRSHRPTPHSEVRQREPLTSKPGRRSCRQFEETLLLNANVTARSSRRFLPVIDRHDSSPKGDNLYLGQVQFPHLRGDCVLSRVIP